MSNSSITHQDPVTKIGTVKLHRDTNPNLTIVLVEGGGDFTVFDTLLNKRFCKVLPIHGRPNVFLTISDVKKNNISGVLAIADKDYDTLTGNLFTEQNLYYIDTHDIETLILNTNIFEKFVKKFIDDNISNDKQLIQNIIMVAAIVGYARLYSAKNEIGLKFSDTPMESYLEQFVSIRYEDYITNIIKYSSQKKIQDLSNNDKDKLKDNILAYIGKSENIEWSLLCRGHDLTAVINYIISQNKVKQCLLNTAATEKELYKFYTMTYFKKTVLYESLLAWQKANPKYRLVL